MSPASRFSADLPPLDSPPRPEEEAAALRLVLVRDIGIQCCAESPNLSHSRRHKSADEAGGEDVEAGQCEERTTKRTYSAELLF